MSANYPVTIIIPTLNESENIRSLIDTVNETFRRDGTTVPEILVMDDNSLDGTIDIVTRAREEIGDNVRIIVRTENHGLSESVIDGFARSSSDIIVVIDADFSHPIDTAVQLYHEIRNGADIAIGSRYIPGGDIVGWPFKRKLISWGATFIARMLFPSISDPVSGFFAVHRRVIDGADLNPIGYKILVEVLGKGRWTTVKEVPYTFTDRKSGTSKLGTGTIVQYVQHIVRIGLNGLTHPGTASSREVRRVLGFILVGLSGVVVNMLILWALAEILGIYYLSAAVVAIEASIINNFVLNTYLVFKARDRLLRRLAIFHGLSAAGVLINMSILVGLTELMGIYYLLSEAIAIIVAFGWNIVMNRRITWVDA